jgi:Coenzyme PQQ synthesis protein D (PqqD)
MQTSITEQIKLDGETSLRLSKEIITRKNQDDTVIVMRLDESALFYKIDGVAAKVWEKLAEPKKVSEVISEFKQQYPQNETQVEHDVQGFLGDLLSKNLIVKCKEPMNESR